MESLASIRALLVAGRPKTWNLGYPADVRRRAAAYVMARRKAGVRPDAIAAELGISRHSVVAWSEMPEGGAALELLPVVVAVDVDVAPSCAGHEPSRRSMAPVLVSPRGFRVEGLDLAAVAVLLERFG